MFDDNINDIRAYNNAMRKSLHDKAFFISMVDATLFVDVGCADGSLLKYLHEQDDTLRLIGYDISDRELQLASANVPTEVTLTYDWDLVKKAIALHNGKSAIVCNSLIHEVYAYGNQESVNTFWGNLLSANADYIIVRDMCVNADTMKKADATMIAKIRKAGDANMIAEFEAIYGSLDILKNAIHFLLKYRYVRNWAREVAENYLPLTYQQLLGCFGDYKIEYAEQFTLPFLRKTVQKDFGIELQEPTHAKLILSK